MGAVTQAWTWLTTGANWAGPEGAWQRLAEHVQLSLVCLALTCLIALPLALWLGHTGRGGALAVNISNAGRAVPTLAVLVLLMLTPLGRQGELPTVVALVLFALPPLLTNAYVGIREADRAVVEAARGMGMSGPQLLWRVELPLGFALIMAGVRSAAVQLVATATLTGPVGGGGLGRIITAGFNTYDTPQVVAGAVLVAVLALLVEATLAAAQWLCDPVRRRPGQASRANPAGTRGGTVPAEAV